MTTLSYLPTLWDTSNIDIIFYHERNEKEVTMHRIIHYEMQEKGYSLSIDIKPFFLEEHGLIYCGRAPWV